MKLLIVDDEKLTREGIRDSVAKLSLPIDAILLADDGRHGLEVAKAMGPDIVLTDIRMPRMTGVDMAEAILEQNPDTAIIFMSAYSDKEYLKAAIKLKAVRYVEKPISLSELADALDEALISCQVRSQTRNAVQTQEKEQQGHLAHLLSQVDTKSKDIEKLVQELQIPVDDSTPFFTMLIDSVTPLSELTDPAMAAPQVEFRQMLAENGLCEIWAFRSDRYVIIHVYSDKKPDKATIRCCAKTLQRLLSPHCRFFLAVGPLVSGVLNVHHSYEKAKLLLENSFFHEFNSILLDYQKPAAPHPPADVLMDFSMALSNKQEETALMLAGTLYDSILNGQPLLPSQVKDMYYKYFVKLDELSMWSHISLWGGHGELNPPSIWDSVFHCTTFKELHQLLLDKTSLFFKQLVQNAGENPVVFQIKEFLHQNYAISSLSVLDVSQHVNRSSSYICTLFKSETGQTLNQYLTDYRIKMSKGFLSDPRYKIADISAKVGYSDGNYYSKTFRKTVGLSPSEYREKMLS